MIFTVFPARPHRHIIHSITAFVTFYGYRTQLYDKDYINHVSKTFAGPFEFLTTLAAIGTILYALVAISTIFMLHLKRLRTDLLAIVMSIECSISIFFWTVYLYDPRLLLVTQKKNYLNPLTDACLHLFPTLGLLLEFFYNLDYPFEDYQRHRKLIITFCCSYICWLLFLKFKNGKWVYPILGIFSNQFLILCLFPSITMMTLGIFSILSKMKRRIKID